MLYKWSQARSTSCINLIFPLNNFYQSVLIPIQNNMRCWWIEIKKGPKYKLNDNIGEFLKAIFWYHSNYTRRNPWVMLCSHCPINDSSDCLHITLYLAVMLQASCILQRVTKSQKVHISSHDLLQKLNNIDFTWHRPRDFLNNQKIFSSNLIIYSPHEMRSRGAVELPIK